MWSVILRPTWLENNLYVKRTTVKTAYTFNKMRLYKAWHCIMLIFTCSRFSDANWAPRNLDLTQSSLRLRRQDSTPTSPTSTPTHTPSSAPTNAPSAQPTLVSRVASDDDADDYAFTDDDDGEVTFSCTAFSCGFNETCSVRGCVCRAGYRWNSAGDGGCEDNDECAAGTHICTGGFVCVNAIGNVSNAKNHHDLVQHYTVLRVSSWPRTILETWRHFIADSYRKMSLFV